MIKFAPALALAAALICSPAHAATLLEKFDEPFAAWKTRWFGANSNATNFVSDYGYRGNNVTGLSVDDGDFFDGGEVTVLFNADFASTITRFSFDLLAFNGQTLRVFDKDGNTLVSFQPPVTGGPVNPPFFSEADFAQSAYSPFQVKSGNGIGGFTLQPFGAAGNFSIDNVSVSTVPEPATWAMMMLGFGVVGGAMRARRGAIRTLHA